MVHLKVCEHQLAINNPICIRACGVRNPESLTPVKKKGKAKLISSIAHKILMAKPLSLENLTEKIKAEYQLNINKNVVASCLYSQGGFIKKGKLYYIEGQEPQKKPKKLYFDMIRAEATTEARPRIDMIVAVMNGNPMHLTEISSKISETFLINMSVNSIIACIGAYRDKFERVDSGYFKLKE